VTKTAGTGYHLLLLRSRAVSSLTFIEQNAMNQVISVPKTRVELTIESILLDSDLFVKYKSPERAVEILQEAIERSPRSIPLREKLREICASQGQISEAARQCLALASLYINREDFESAYDRLQEAKLLDPRISIAPGLEAIRRAKHPEFGVPISHKTASQTAAATPDAAVNAPVQFRRDAAFAGNLLLVGLFDVIQVAENSKLTGLLTLKSDKYICSLAFNVGRIVDAEVAGITGTQAFRKIVELTEGVFEFTLSEKEFPVVIQALSNTNLLLDTLSDMDEEKQYGDA
jgi:tetratricopeptide (TPR) repeat protein